MLNIFKFSHLKEIVESLLELSLEKNLEPWLEKNTF